MRNKARATKSGAELCAKLVVFWPIRLAIHCALLVAMFRVAYDFRRDEEMFLSKHILDTFVENHFDSSHNTFESIRRTHDIWEWGNTVLWPGLLGNNGCEQDFSLTLRHDPGNIATNLVQAKNGTCVEGYPDGDGSFHTEDAKPFTVAELAEYMDDVDWTEGIEFRVLRVKEYDEKNNECESATFGPKCRPSIATSNFIKESYIDQADFEYHTSSTGPYHPFVYHSTSSLGSSWVMSSSVYSARVPVPSPGYVAVVLPFFSETFLEEVRGNAEELQDYLKSQVTRENNKTPNFFCVRLSTDGKTVTQLCDPNKDSTPGGVTTGVVRAACEALWNDLKRGRFIDYKTRALTISLQLRSNNMGVAARATLLAEITSAGGVLPSYYMQTTPMDLKSKVDVWMYTAMGLAIYFVIFELLEMYQVGLLDYMNDMWNLADWATMIVIFVFVGYVSQLWNFTEGREAAIANDRCSALCKNVGYFDAQQEYEEVAILRDVLSMTLLLLLLKTLKFVAMMLPATGLMINVMAKAKYELIFFSIMFLICVFAFAITFWVQLGSQLPAFSSLGMSFITVMRALFGDFDLDAIGERFNPLGFTVVLFLVFLFSAIFIILSMFLAILGEAQSAVRDEQSANEEEAFSTKVGFLQRILDPASVQDTLEYCLSGVKKAHKTEVKINEIKLATQDVAADEAPRMFKKLLKRMDDLFGDEIVHARAEASTISSTSGSVEEIPKQDS